MNGKIITDPDELNIGTEVLVDCENYTIELIDNTENTASNIEYKLDIETLYHFFMEEWRCSSELMKYKFPFFVSDFSVLFTNGWKPKNQKTVDLLDGKFMFEDDNKMVYCNTDIDDLRNVAIEGCKSMIGILKSRIDKHQSELDRYKRIVGDMEDNIKGLDKVEGGEKELIYALFALQIYKSR